MMVFGRSCSPGLCCWLLFLFAASPLSSAQQQPIKILAVNIRNVAASVFIQHDWAVSNTANRQTLSVPVGANKGWAQVRYTVAYTRTRRPLSTYRVAGQIAITELTGRVQVFELPRVSISVAQTTVAVPSNSINCPSSAVTPRGTLACSFVVEYQASSPVPGTVSASVSIPGTLLPFNLQAADVPFDFAGAAIKYVGDSATVSNYFEQGDGLLQPAGVSGEQPPPGLVLQDSREFSYLAQFGNLDASLCGRSWKAMSTAHLKAGDAGPTAPLLQSVVTVTLQLVGCALAAQQPSFAGTPAAALPAAPVAVAPAPALAAPVAASTPARTPPGGPVPPGITFAEAGSTLCGGGACAPGSRCFDGWNCCPTDTQVCGGVCCDGGRVCINNQCAAQGSALCGSAVCAPGQQCIGNVCCTADRVVCGGSCCAQGQQCVAGQCAAAGSTACGRAVCGPRQQCAQGVCCAAGETNCGGRCCREGYTCLLGRYCVPQGSSVCQAQVCVFPQQCAGGMRCCNPSQSLCGGSCCSLSCIQDRCLPAGSSVCGPNVCDPSRVCLNNQVCCNRGETFCNTGCCASGNVCINNACVPQGSMACGPTVVCTANQFCGNPFTGLCCQRNQIACGRDCCPVGQVCNQAMQRCAVPGTASMCTSGQFWCPLAGRCCTNGWVCTAGRPCVPPWG